MHKQLVVLFGIVAISSANADNKNFEGPYLQGALGYESVSGNVDSNVIRVTAGAGAGTYNVNTQVNSSNGLAEVAGMGYGFRFSPRVLMTVGAEYSLNNRDLSYSSTATGLIFRPSNITLSSRYSVYVAPGYEIDSSSVVYGKVGYTSSKVRVNDGSTDQTTLTGYILGAGYKKFFKDNIYGFAELNYIKFNSSTISGNGTTFTGTYSYNVGGNAYNTLVGVGYKF